MQKHNSGMKAFAPMGRLFSAPLQPQGATLG